MAASVATTDGANERAAKTKIRRVGGLLAVLGIQSWTIGPEQASGGPRRGTLYLFCIFIFRIYFLHLFISI